MSEKFPNGVKSEDTEREGMLEEDGDKQRQREKKGVEKIRSE